VDDICNVEPMGILRHTQGRGDIKAHPKDAQLGLPEVPLMGLERPPRAGFLCNSFQLILLTINLIALAKLESCRRCRGRRLDDWAR
jgi:hypothetical protein